MTTDPPDKIVASFIALCLKGLTGGSATWAKTRKNVEELISELSAEAPGHPAVAQLHVFIAGQDQREAESNRKPRKITINTHIGSRVRLRRIELNMSQIELAAALGISVPRLRRHEKGTLRIDASGLFTLTKILQTPPSYFFEGYMQNDEEE